MFRSLTCNPTCLMHRWLYDRNDAAIRQSQPWLCPVFVVCFFLFLVLLSQSCLWWRCIELKVTWTKSRASNQNCLCQDHWLSVFAVVCISLYRSELYFVRWLQEDPVNTWGVKTRTVYPKITSCSFLLFVAFVCKDLNFVQVIFNKSLYCIF